MTKSRGGCARGVAVPIRIRIDIASIARSFGRCGRWGPRGECGVCGGSGRRGRRGKCGKSGMVDRFRRFDGSGRSDRSGWLDRPARFDGSGRFSGFGGFGMFGRFLSLGRFDSLGRFGSFGNFGGSGRFARQNIARGVRSNFSVGKNLGFGSGRRNIARVDDFWEQWWLHIRVGVGSDFWRPVAGNVCVSGCSDTWVDIRSSGVSNWSACCGLGSGDCLYDLGGSCRG